MFLNYVHAVFLTTRFNQKEKKENKQTKTKQNKQTKTCENGGGVLNLI